jgi:hypothetical protein
MASAIYPKAKEALLKGEIDLLNDDLIVYLVDDGDYTYSSTHETLSDLTVSSRVSSVALSAGKTVTNGLFDADNVIFPSVSGDASEVIVIYDSTSDNLISYHDGISVTPNGNDINLIFNASGIFQL